MVKKILITLLLLTVSSFVYADPWKGYPYNSDEIPEDAVPNEKILKHYLKKYILSLAANGIIADVFFIIYTTVCSF